MKNPTVYWLLIMLAGAINLRATDRYVALDGTNDIAGGYTNWAGAATNIQDAVRIATSSDRVLVSNGVYYFSTSTAYIASDFNYDGSTAGIRTNFSLVCMTNRITLQSVNGPADTIIDGYQRGTSNFVANGIANGVLLAYNSIIKGFTVRNCSTTNGVERWVVRTGGGIHIHQGGTMSNCVVTGCSASHGGGVSMSPSGTVYNCVISNNMTTTGEAGGLYLQGCTAGMARDSIVCNNNSAGVGGIFLNGPGVSVSNCVVTRNTSTSSEGSAVMSRSGGLVVNCQIVSNTIAYGYLAYYEGTNHSILNSSISCNSGHGVRLHRTAVPMKSIVRNCLISGNSGYGIYTTIATNDGNIIEGCTIVKNSSGGLYTTNTTVWTGTLGATNPASVLNCIFSGNSIADIKLFNATNTIFYNCCATNDLPAGQGNITNNPQFVDLANGNYRLSANSPCVNTGTNQDWMTNSVDLDGRQRIRYGIVDMGAYEGLYEGTVFCAY